MPTVMPHANLLYNERVPGFYTVDVTTGVAVVGPYETREPADKYIWDMRTKYPWDTHADLGVFEVHTDDR